MAPVGSWSRRYLPVNQPPPSGDHGSRPKPSAKRLKTSTASTFGQRVAYEIFGEPGALTEQSAWYRAQRQRVIAALDASGLEYVPIDGAR